MNIRIDFLLLTGSLILYILYKMDYKNKGGDKWENFRAKGRLLVSILCLVIVTIDVLFKFMSYF